MLVVPADQLETMRAFLYTSAFLMGAVWGSFLNVVVYRLPRGLSLIKPASRCPGCETPIKARDNVPILGWLLLKGRCRACNIKISPRYPLVEFAMGLLSLALAVKVFGGRMEVEDLRILLVPYGFGFAFLAALLTLFLIDIDVTELPPEITIPGIGVGLLSAWLTDKAGALVTYTPNVTVSDAALGAVIGAGVILVLFVGYLLLTGRVGMGGGDLWMMGMVGAFLGWQSLLFIFLASSVQGILVAAVAAVVTKGKPEGALFRNDEVNALNDELRAARADGTGGAQAGGAQAGGAQTDGAQTHDAPTDAPTDAGADDPSFGKLAVPFGPFIALSAAEYVFIGHWVLPWLTGGVVGPNGFLI